MVFTMLHQKQPRGHIIQGLDHNPNLEVAGPSVLIVDLHLSGLDEWIEFSNLEFEELDHILGGSMLDLKGSRELKCRLELAEKGFETMDDIFRNV